jgi:hypothetical protein
VTDDDCPQDDVADFWTSKGGSTEANDTLAAQGEDYGGYDEGNGQASTTQAEVYCGCATYSQHYAMCVGVDY